MRRYLVISNQTLSSDAFDQKIRSCLAEGPCHFHVVVPATHTHDHMTWTEGHDRAVARQRLESALAHLVALGADVDGEVGDARALDAVRDAVRDRPPFDEVILFTLPPGVSRWLHQDLPHRVEKVLARSVTHVVAEPVTA
jgi:hypothetical protein